jgi:hypothetical protein
MKHFKQMVCLTIVLCAGCSGSDNRQASPSGPGANATDFSTFVSQLVSSTPSETAAPVEVESANFTFADDDNPAAFDAVISAAP